MHSGNPTFGALLRGARRRARLTQAELGIAVGYSDAQICRLESGRRAPDLVALVALFFPALDLEPASAAAQLLLAAASAARTTGAARAAPGIPIRLDPMLFGRGRERVAVADLLGGGARLVTLLGPPGIGKTRLALQVSADLAARYAEGAAFVDLSALDDAARVPDAIASALDISQESFPDAAAALRQALGDRRLLLVLDNFEQVIDAAPALRALLAAAPGLALLVTSRLALRLAAEHIVAVPPLEVPDLTRLPDLDALARIESVALLLDRLRAAGAPVGVTADNALTLAAICARADGVPLAIELIAARGRLLAPHELLAEVAQQFATLRRSGRDVPARHASLTAAIDWSYARLTPPAQTLFARLSLFAGSFAADDAAAICDLERDGRAASLDALDLLLNHSLIQRGEDAGGARLTMLAMVRAAAEQRRQGLGEDQRLYGGALDYFGDLAARAAAALSSGFEQAAWVARLEASHETMRAALSWAQRSGDGRGLRLAGELGRFWYHRGYLHEGRAWLESFLDLPDGRLTPVSAAVRARALDNAGLLTWRQGEYALADERYAATLPIYRASSDAVGTGRVLLRMGLIAGDRSDMARSRGLLEQSLEHYRAAADQQGIAAALHNLGNLACQLNDHDTALARYAECSELYDELDDRSGQALIGLGMGAVARDRGDLALAERAFGRSLELARALADAWNMATALLNLGDLAADRREPALALRYLDESLALFERVADQQGIAMVHLRHSFAALLCGDGAAARQHARQGLLVASGIGYAAGVADALAALAGGCGRAQPLVAAQLLAAAEGIRQMHGAPIALADRPLYEQIVASARSAASDDAWQRAWARGAALAQTQAVALALASVA